MEEFLKSEDMESMIKFTRKVTDIKNSEANQQTFQYKGYRFFSPFSLEATKYVNEELKLPENSIIISSFPKTGTAWCSEIVRQIVYSKDAKLLELVKSAPMALFVLEMGNKKKFELLNKVPLPRKVLATHLCEEIFNYEDFKKSNSKMIYIMRNPKDQAVSWFHFAKKIPLAESLKKEMGEEWNEFFDNYVNGRHANYTKEGEFYVDNLREWLKHKDDENFLVVAYEDMKKDFPREIRRMAKFLEIELDNSEVDRITDVCSIKSMQQAAETDKTGLLKMNVRKGEVGGWKDQFTVAQSELMDKIIDEKLAGTGIEFTYTL